MFAKDARNSGIAAGSGPVDPTVAWTFEAAGDLRTNAVVSEGTVFVGSQDANVYALSAADGSELWRFPLRSGVDITLAVDENAVYAGDRTGRLYALEVETGTRRWVEQLDDSNRISNITLARGGLYAPVPETGRIYRFDTHTGAIEANLDVGTYLNEVPAFVGDTVYVGWGGDPTAGPSRGGGLDAMTTDGERLWRVEPGEIRGAPTPVEDVVYVSSTEATHAYDASSGEERWRFEAASNSGSPTVADGLAFLGSMSSTFYGVDAATGEQVWEFTPGRWPNNAPVVADGVVYLTSGANRVYGLDAATGEKRWRHQLSELPGDPVVADETVYVAAKNTLLALRDE